MLVVGVCGISEANVGFNVIAEFLNFNVYNPEGKDWEKFQREWRQPANFFISREPEINEANFEESDAPEEVPKKCPQPRVPTEPSTSFRGGRLKTSFFGVLNFYVLLVSFFLLLLIELSLLLFSN
ncbi:hypothetical protein PVK06_023357 [Gossypium arboreum]|uniref:Uncharacterized protein n=1 Tax=Gossypium arboreum TaxID=29729 RepID=A0ABR0PB28_GOSAR|nr:hypothetical protein PVK06_023357 [Gossypium arboreum]